MKNKASGSGRQTDGGLPDSPERERRIYGHLHLSFSSLICKDARHFHYLSNINPPGRRFEHLTPSILIN